MELPQTMYFNGYILKQNKNFHVLVKDFKSNKRVGHFQCDHCLSGEELMSLANFLDEMRNGNVN